MHSENRRVETIPTTALIDQNTEKSPRNWKRLGFTQTPVKDHHLTVSVPLFNGISTFLAYLMPKPPFEINRCGTI